MFLKVSLLIYTLICVVFCEIEKCCDFNEQFEYNNTNSEFLCVKQKNKRVQMVTNSTNFLNNESNGTCYDVINSTFYGKIDNGNEMIKREILQFKNYFPKCCPLNFVYNEQRHACDENSDYLIDIKENFAKIGLPKCRVIQDLNFNTLELLEEKVSKVKINNISYCTDRTDNGDYILRTCDEKSTKICENRKCVRKCCSDGKSLGQGANCINDFKTGLNMTFSKRVIQPEGNTKMSNIFPFCIHESSIS